MAERDVMAPGRASGRKIYLALTEASDLAAAVDALRADELTTVSEYISTLPGGGISAQVFGVVSARMAQSGRKVSGKGRKI